MTWLSASSLFGLARWIWLAAVAVALTALVIWLCAAETADDRTNQQLGAAVQRADDLQATLERTEDAHEARNAIRDPDNSARYDQCLRTARTPAHCERFLSRGTADRR